MRQGLEAWRQPRKRREWRRRLAVLLTAAMTAAQLPAAAFAANGAPDGYVYGEDEFYGKGYEEEIETATSSDALETATGSDAKRAAVSGVKRNGETIWEIESDFDWYYKELLIQPGDTVIFKGWSLSEWASTELVDRFSEVQVIIGLNVEQNLIFKYKVRSMTVNEGSKGKISLEGDVEELTVRDAYVQIGSPKPGQQLGTVCMEGGRLERVAEAPTVTDEFIYRGGNLEGPFELNLEDGAYFRNESGGEVTVTLNGRNITLASGAEIYGFEVKAWHPSDTEEAAKWLAEELRAFNTGGTGNLEAEADGATVTVTGSVSGVRNLMDFLIPDGVTVEWQAEYEGSESEQEKLVAFDGAGLFHMDRGRIECTGDGHNSYALGLNNGRIEGSAKVRGRNGITARSNYSDGRLEIGGDAEVISRAGTVLESFGPAITISGGRLETHGTMGKGGILYAIVVNDGSLVMSGGELLADGEHIAGISIRKNCSFVMSGGRILMSGDNADGVGVWYSSGTVRIIGGMIAVTGRNSRTVYMEDVENGFIDIGDSDIGLEGVSIDGWAAQQLDLDNRSFTAALELPYGCPFPTAGDADLFAVTPSDDGASVTDIRRLDENTWRFQVTSGCLSQSWELYLTANQTPVPQELAAAPEVLDFGSMAADAAGSKLPPAQTVTVTNTGKAYVNSFTVEGAEKFEVVKTDASLMPGRTAAFTVQPKAGLAVGTWEEKITVRSDGGAKAEVTAKVVVTRKAEPELYSVTVEHDGGGTAGADYDKAAKGTPIELKAVPGNGYHFKEWQGAENLAFTQGSSTSQTAVFTMPGRDVAVKAIFEKDAPGNGNGSSDSSSDDDPRVDDRILHGTWEQQEDGGWKFHKTDGEYARDQWGKVGGLWYHFDRDADMQTGWQNVDGQWYYLATEEDAENRSGTGAGVETGSGSSGGVKTGSMMTGWYYDVFYQRWFYLDKTGAMATGWQQIDGKWYYFNPLSDGMRGAMLADAWIDGWYVGPDGAWVE